MTKIDYDYEAQKNLAVPLGKRELYPSVGNYIAEVLKEQGVTTAFGVPGGHIWHFVDAISRIGVKLIVFCHEQNSVYAAEAYSQVTGKPVVAFGTVGPGAGNAFSPMHQAFLSNTPIVYLAGGHELEHDGLFNTLQESYASEFFKSITKYSTRLFYPHQIKQFITRGFKIAQQAPGGPVCFEMGIDLLTSTDELRKHMYAGVFPQHSEYIPNWRDEQTTEPLKNAADPVEIAKAAKLISEARNVYMIIGDQATWDKAGAPIEEFINLTKTPFTTRRLGRGLVSEKHPLYYRGMPPVKREIDLIITCGVKVGFFDHYGHGWKNTIQISNCPEQVWPYVKTGAALVGSIDVVFKQLNDYIKANKVTMAPEKDAWVKKIQEARKNADQRRKEKSYKYGPDHPRYKNNNFLHHGYMSQIIREVIEENYDNKVRVMIDGFTISDYAMPYLQFNRPSSCLTSNDYAGVGHGVGQAIGAAIADIENDDVVPVLALMGDSGMMNAGWDAVVGVDYKLPIVFLVTNNGGWMPAMKYAWYGPNWDAMGDQDAYGAKFKNGVTLRGQERAREAVDFVKFAESIGAKGMRCDRSENFRDALTQAFKMSETEGPVVLECMMDYHLTNRSVTTMAYALMYAHIPWDELPPRGKAARRTHLNGMFPALKELPEMKIPDPWDAYTEEEMGYEPKNEDFK
jgi:Thiamine pyrophosphate-requiring enzymes [acetolactate synthase, pyruvate dehydrogenase (cytochrome), glyoxylate carboligase, phosphonopyruvate decarboxylase]